MLSTGNSCVKIGASDRIDELLSLPKCEGYCRGGGKPNHLRSLAQPGRERVVRFACKSWHCRVCGAWLRAKAGQHFGMMIVQSDGVLFSQRIEPSEWKREKKRFERDRTEWVRIGSLVIGCAPSKYETVYSDRDECVRRLGIELRAIVAPAPTPGKRFRPIASSDGWRPPKKPRKYERVGWVTVSNPVSVVDRLREIGIEGARIKTRPGIGVRLWDVVFDCPPELKVMTEYALSY